MKTEVKFKLLLAFVLAAILVVGIVTLRQPEVEVLGYELHTVQDGETMWRICKEHNPECEYVGELVKYLMQENEKTSSVVYPGEAVVVPVVK